MDVPAPFLGSHFSHSFIRSPGKQVWAIRFWLDQHQRLRDRALFDFAIGSKLRGCDVAKVRIGDIVAGGRILRREKAFIIYKATGNLRGCADPAGTCSDREHRQVPGCGCRGCARAGRADGGVM